ncbi:spike base protein, RCAP_Rcc01079 family [Agrobacterium tumefaciens]|uniref:spike base protein, RCAP_Rcc01079 family n=1 Tax=Agrobacterium tumefaciens TaxID=358 RepID=UPI00157721D1|nr:hypothetical protein [Agrobacterium tumefaciens]NTZ90454.1 hypothetical protein [Agrobacterium tumefaciens]
MAERNQYGTEPGRLFNIAKSDTVDLANDTRGLIIGTEGDIKVTDDKGVTDTFTMPAGVFPIRVRRIWNTGTTASGLVGIY